MFNYSCVCICLSMSVSLCVSVCGYVHGGQEKASEPLELEFQVLPDVGAGIRTLVSLQGFLTAGPSL